MKTLLISLFAILTFTVAAHSADGPLVRDTGELDFECTQSDNKQKPFNYFYLTMMVNESADFELFGLFDLENLFGAGNNNFFYRVKAVQFPYYLANILPNMQTIPGCELAPLSLTVKDSGKLIAQFQCAENGDMGQGTLLIDPETMQAQGTFYFPKNKPKLIYPIEAGTQVDVTCKQRTLAI